MISVELSTPRPALLYSHPGALEWLAFVAFPEISGPFDLWKGEWWRVAGSVFHHVNLVHLLMNSFALWSMADIVEPKLGRLRYLLFFLSAGVFSMLPTLYMNQPAVGLSGVCYAIFGLLAVLRHHDDEIRERVPPQFLTFGMGWLLGCVVLTRLKLMPVANEVHVAGLVYGIVIGWLCYDVKPRRPWLARAAVATILLLIVGATVAIMHPRWEARYIAWQAVTSDDPALFEQAVTMNPRMTTAWHRLIGHRVMNDDIHGAWTTTLTAALNNRNDDEFIRKARLIWRLMGSAIERARALDELKHVFGKESDAWLERLRLPVSPLNELNRGLDWIIDEIPRVYDPDEMQDIPAHVPGITPELAGPDAPKIDPDDPHSAMLGESV